jgi:hypothetical protein
MGGEDEAVGIVVGASYRLVADGEALTGFKVQEGELAGSGCVVAERACDHGGEDR